MTINLDLQPPPQFDRSLIGYATINFNRIRDAFRTALGGNYQSGIFVANFVAAASVFGNQAFNPAFIDPAAANYGPQVILNTTFGLASGYIMYPYVTGVEPASFNYHIASGTGAITQAFSVRWVAFYP